jgi:hypothetical protein
MPVSESFTCLRASFSPHDDKVCSVLPFLPLFPPYRCPKRKILLVYWIALARRESSVTKHTQLQYIQFGILGPITYKTCCLSPQKCVIHVSEPWIVANLIISGFLTPNSPQLSLSVSTIQDLVLRNIRVAAPVPSSVRRISLLRASTLFAHTNS